MKLTLTMTTKFRKNLIMVLNTFKVLLMINGSLLALLFVWLLDSRGDFGDLAMRCTGCGVLMMLASMLIEMFTIKFLVKDGEHIVTIFDFSFYGLKNRKTYKEYMRAVIRQRKLDRIAEQKAYEEKQHDKLARLENLRVS